VQGDGKRTIKVTEKPRNTPTRAIPKFHVDLLTKVFIPIAPGQQEFRGDCRILMTEPDGMDRCHFHRRTVNLFMVVEGQPDVVCNWLRFLKEGE